MSTPITMPQLGESVAEGTIGRWLKQPGDWVAKDEPLAEIITDKVNAELPSPVAGRVEQLLVEEGATVGVGAEIARVAADAPAGGEAQAPAGAPAEQPAAANTEPARPSGAGDGAAWPSGSGAAGMGRSDAAAPDEARADVGMFAGTLDSLDAPVSRASAAPAAAPGASRPGDGDEGRQRIRSSPLVRRLAEEHHVDLRQVTGTGIGGR